MTEHRLTRDDFLIRDDVIFFNHGAFGACPKSVFECYQAWQLELERQPVDFLLRRGAPLMADARARIADYFNVPSDEIVFVTNATTGLSRAVRSLSLQPGDEILTTDHEYGAVNRLLDFVADRTGAQIVRSYVRLPYRDDARFVDDLFADATAKTRAIVISHITSPTSLIFPVQRICERARAEGILTIIDGAHAPGQLPVDLKAIGADMYSGNFHKWLCAPKGSGFLHVRPEHHASIDPLEISHGVYDGSGFVERNEWQGTRDIAAFLTAPAAIDYQRERNWRAVRAECHRLALQAQTRLCNRYQQTPFSENQFAQKVTVPLPQCDVDLLRRRLYDDYRIEAPVGKFADQCEIRISVQAYNTSAEIDLLIAALDDLLDESSKQAIASM
ncbi:MAG: aminotransferase class V-fold PLP-dependent enzyme [Chloroflexi bacterium]|nr:aminotransferase class V-fold PLP-dependent enzyme [Chloroflexota bacterium]